MSYLIEFDRARLRFRLKEALLNVGVKMLVQSDGDKFVNARLDWHNAERLCEVLESAAATEAQIDELA